MCKITLKSEGNLIKVVDIDRGTIAELYKDREDQHRLITNAELEIIRLNFSSCGNCDIVPLSKPQW